MTKSYVPAALTSAGRVRACPIAAMLFGSPAMRGLARAQVWSRAFLVAASLLTLSVQALTPGPRFILECPGCHAPVKFDSIGSGNTFGAKFWTDGKMEAPMLPDKSPIAKCPKCAHLFWLAKAKQVAEIEFGSPPSEAEKWEKTPNPVDPGEQDLLQVPQPGKLNRDEQITVCMRAWWLANDKVRNSPQAQKATFSEAQHRNLKRLSSLLDKQNPGERIRKAEIARELGDFDECRRLLSAKFEKPDQSKDADFLRRLAAKKDALVRQFP